MNVTKWRTVLGDLLLLSAAGFVFVQQGISKDPKIEVMVLCIVVLTGRTALALKTWIGGGNDTQSVSPSEDSSGSSRPPSSPS